MVSTFGFNGFLKSTSNLNLMYKPSDSGYYSFDTVVSSSSNNYPVTNTSGFLQCIVEGQGSLVAQYLYYSNNTQYFRVGEVTLSTAGVVLYVVWSTWNYLINETFFDDKPDKTYYQSNFVPITRADYNTNRSYHTSYSNSQFWTPSASPISGIVEGIDMTFEYKGDVDSSFDIFNSTKRVGSGAGINGWYYKKDTAQGNFPRGGTGILKVFTSANTTGDVAGFGERQFIFISDTGEYCIGRAKGNSDSITWDYMITKSDYWLTFNQNITNIENMMYTDTVRSIRMSSASYQNWVDGRDITLNWGGPWLLVNTSLNMVRGYVYSGAAWFRTPQIYRTGVWSTVETV